MKLRAYILSLLFTQAVCVSVFAQGLIIPSGGYVGLNNGYLVLGKNFENNGKFVQKAGTVIFAGGTQTIGGQTQTEFDNVSIATGSNTTIATGPQFLKSILLCNGTFNANNKLTLLSTQQQTALIDGSGTGQVLGKLTMQRYLSSGFGYTYFGTAFQDATVNEFAEEVNLNASFPAFYRYDENQVSTGWLTYTAAGNTLVAGQGYAANLGTSNAPVTVNVTGTVNNGTVVSSLYNHNRTYTKGFNLVGNPYPSPIDWNATSGWVRNNVDNALYYFNASTTDQYGGTYSSYINGVSSDGIAGNLIPSMQGFFVHVTDGTYPVAASFSISNDARTDDLNPGPLMNPNIPPIIRLSAGYADDWLQGDRAVFYLDAGASKKFDKKRDALKLMNTNKDVPNLYAVADDTSKLSIHAFVYPQDTATSYPLGLKTEKDGWITFNAPQVQQIPAGLYIYLYDQKLKEYHDLKTGPAYRLYLSAGQYEQRFSLVFSKKQLLTDNNDNVFFKAYYAGGNLFINTNIPADDKSVLLLLNLNGQHIWQRPFKGTASYPLNASIAKGIYVVKLVSAIQIKSEKIVIND
ncbi:MAG TPA: T9SS type A sorting domain-containing protein [Panacibacter sp.]|nr:T9SS type A sorting domain-containing protein [Panacibacter sp.]HNP42663.1 T9SS type A sorting domain-containing protein [Panacibacter sp.]